MSLLEISPHHYQQTRNLLIDLFSSDAVFFSLLVLLTFLVILLDSLSEAAKKKQQASGVEPQISRLFAKEENFKATREYSSKYQKLQASPDAILIENGQVIPVERKININKIRDRHIIQLLVQMRLIEEFEGKKPPYGYLILGKNAKRVKVLNSKKKQDWLQQIILEMREIIDKKQKAVADPHVKKCKKCWAKKYCPDALLITD